MSTDLPIAPGELIAGKYRVERLLGDGGMGVVVAATHVKLNERRAIKMMRPAITMSTEATRRFLREAQAAAKLKSEHVAKVYDVDEMAGGVPFMVMEYLEGADLAAVLAGEGALPIPEAVLYIRQACEAIAEAHAAGLVHRDIKPSNLFLTKRPDGAPCIKVLDFGIAKAVMSDGVSKTSAMTAQGAMLGTAHYMSPEQMDTPADIDARTDIWSLGVTLYELVSGKVPFDADGLLKLFALVTEGEPRPLTEVAPHVPPELEAIVLRCLEKQRDRRPATPIELADALEPFAPQGGARSIRARNLVAVQARASAPTEAAPAVSAKARTSLDMELDTAAAPRERVAPPPEPRADAGAAVPAAPVKPPPSRRLLMAGGIATIGAAAAAALFALRPAASPPPATAPTVEPARTQGASNGTPRPPSAESAATASAPPPIVEPASAAPAPPPPPSASAPASAAPPRPRPSPAAKPPAQPARPATPSRTEVNIP